MASDDIGDLGPREGKPVSYHWYLLWHMASFLPWLALLPLFALKANRRPAAWLILIPVAIAYAVMIPLSMASSFLGGAGGLSIASTCSPVVGLAAIWLLAHVLAGFHRAASFFLALAIMLVPGTVAALGAFGAGGFMFGMIAYAISSLVLLLALVLGRVFARKSRGGGVFTAWLLLASVTVTALSIIPFFLIMIVSGPLRTIGTRYLLAAMTGMLTFACVSGLLVFLVLLPFVILSFKSRFYRERFTALFRPPWMPPPVAPPEAPQQP